MSSLRDPFDLMDTQSNIVPLLNKAHLDDMTSTALGHAQLVPKEPFRLSRMTWFSSGIAMAACLLLLVSFGINTNPAPSFNPAGTPIVISSTDEGITPHATATPVGDDDPSNDFGDMVMLATFGSQ